MGIQDMTPDERLTAAAIILRDAIEKHDYEAELARVSRLNDGAQAETTDSK